MSLAASPAQRAKVKDQHCLVCGMDRHETKIDPAHVYPRRFAHCECADGVVALCRAHHRLYDERLGNERLDLLPRLMEGFTVELVHAILEHGASPQHLLEVVTGVKWEPSSAYAESLAS